MVAFRSPLAASLPPLPAPQSGDLRPVYDTIGYTSVSHPPRRPFSLPTPTINGHPALEVKDVEWSLFYPCEVPETPEPFGDVPWVVGPLSSVVAGYERFLGVSKYLLGLSFNLLVSYPQTILPGLHRNAPLCAPAAGQPPWPLLVFSHGLGGGKHVYSQLCRYYASRGYCVLAMQHKDGTGPATAVRDYKTGKETDLLYVRNDELTWETYSAEPDLASPSADDKIPLRRAQLRIRQAEVYEAYDAFASLVGADGSDETTARLNLEDDFQVADWTGKVDVQRFHLGGHSFGGATTMHILSNPPPEGLPKLPIRSVLLLDPWLDPLPQADDPKLAVKSLPPALVVNSEYFTLWTAHFDRLAAIVRQWGGGAGTPSCWGTTLLRSEHQSFSDFPLLLPTLPGLPFASAPKKTITPESLLGSISRLSETFLSTGSPVGAQEMASWDGSCDEGRLAVDEIPRPQGWLRSRGERKPRRVLRGVEGEVCVHFRGS